MFFEGGHAASSNRVGEYPTPPAEVTGGTAERFRLTPQRQHEAGMRLKMGEPAARIARAYGVDVNTIGQLAR